MADRTEKVVLELEVDESESIESINALTKANKELRAERNALNLQSEAGKKRAQEINALLDQNTNKIKTNVSAIEKQKINIGNYKSALDGVHPVLGKVGEGLEAGTKGFMGMARAALAFIATPIGAALAAIVAVFTLLKSALSQNDELMEKFENITNAVGVVLEVVVARVGELGEALIKLASGDFTGAIDSASAAFKGLGDEIAIAVKQQQLFLDASRELEDDTIALSIAVARNENEIKRLNAAAKDRSKSLEEQEGFLKTALALEQETAKAKEDIARRDLVITARTLRSEQEFQQKSSESFDQYVKRLLDSAELEGDEKKKIAEKLIALERAKGESLDNQQKIANNLAAIEEKRTEGLNKQTQALDKNSDAERNARIAKLERESQEQRGDPLSDAFQTTVKVETDLTALMKDQLAERQQDLDKYYDDKNKKAAQSAAFEEQQERQKFAIIGGFIGGISQLMREESEEQKLITSAQALMNTSAAAIAAYKSGSQINVAFGIISAAAAVAYGLAQVAKINGIEFAEGGYTGPGHRLQPAGIVHAGEVVWSQEDVRRVGGPGRANAMRPTFPKAGVYTHADGGIVVDSLTAGTNQQLALSNIIKSIPPGEVSVVEIARVDRRVKVKEKISKR